MSWLYGRRGRPPLLRLRRCRVALYRGLAIRRHRSNVGPKQHCLLQSKREFRQRLAARKVVRSQDKCGKLGLVKGIGMSVKKKVSRERAAGSWATRLMKCVRAVLDLRPEADPDNVRPTLILLERPPLERLRNSLIRGRALPQRKLQVLRIERIFASKRAANRAKDRLVIPVLEDALAASQVAAQQVKRKPTR